MAFFDKNKKNNVKRDEEKYYVGQDTEEQIEETLKERRHKAKWWKIGLGGAAGASTIAFPWAADFVQSASDMTALGIGVGASALILDSAFIMAVAYGFKKPLKIGKDAINLEKKPDKFTRNKLHPQNARQYINEASRGVSQDKLDEAKKEVESEKLREYVKFDGVEEKLVLKFRDKYGFKNLTDGEKKQLAKAMRPNEEKIIKSRNGNVTKLSYPYKYESIIVDGETVDLKSKKVRAYTLEGHLIYEQQLASLGADVVLEFDLNGIKGKHQKATLDSQKDDKAEEKRTETLTRITAFQKSKEDEAERTL